MNRILLISEDTGADGQRVALRLFLHACQILRPDLATQRLRAMIELAPQQNKGKDRGRFRGANASYWKAKKPRDPEVQQALNDLNAAIQEYLKQRDATYLIVWHIDGDRPWSRRQDSENGSRFQKICEAYRQAGCDVDRIIAVLPFYSIEAWCYQNLDMMKELYPQNIDLIEHWKNDRTSLDEYVNPKDVFDDKNNSTLVDRGWPRREVFDARASFHAQVERMRACTPLMALLDGF